MSRALATLANSLKEGKVQKDTLDRDVRLNLTEFLRMEGWRTGDIADLVGVSGNQVRSDYATIQKRMGQELDQQTVSEIAAEHARRGWNMADKLQRDATRFEEEAKNSKIPGEKSALLAKSKEYLLDAWKARREVIQDLQGVGFIAKAPVKVNLSGSVQHEHQHVHAHLTSDELRARFAECVESEQWARDAIILAGGTPPEGLGFQPARLLPDGTTAAFQRGPGAGSLGHDGEHHGSDREDHGCGGSSPGTWKEHDPEPGDPALASPD